MKKMEKRKTKKSLMESEKWGEVKIKSKSDFNNMFYRRLSNTMQKRNSLSYMVSYASFLIAFICISLSVFMYLYYTNNTTITYVYKDAAGNNSRNIHLENKKSGKKYEMKYDNSNENYTLTLNINKKDINNLIVINEKADAFTYYVVDYGNGKKIINMSGLSKKIPNKE
jgi:hypothetical protein